MPTLIAQSAIDLAAGAGTETKALPGTRLQGDLVIVYLSSDDAVTGGSAVGYGVAIVHNTTDDPLLYAAGTFMGSTPDTDVVVNRSTTFPIAGIIEVWRGVDPTTPLDVAVPAVVADVASNYDPPQIIPVTDGCAIIVFCAKDDVLEETVYSPPANYGSLFANQAGVAGAGNTCVVAHRILATAATENPGVFTGGGTSDLIKSSTFALRPFADPALTQTKFRVYADDGVGLGEAA